MIKQYKSNSFRDLVFDHSKNCHLSDSIIKSVNCIATLIDDILLESKEFNYQDFINLLEELISANPERFNYQNILDDLKKYDLQNINKALNFITIFFHLLNQIELMEIARINFVRGNQATKSNPRPDSIFDAVKKIYELQITFKDAEKYVNRLDIQPTFTAHPTEARRKLVMKKQKVIINLIEKYIFFDLGLKEKEEIYNEIKHQLNILLLTDEIPAKRVTVLDEVKYGIYFCLNSIWDAIPTIYRDLEKAFKLYYGKTPKITSFLKFRTWTGGDRDGNPNVISEISKESIRLKREAIFKKYLSSLEVLDQELSISSRKLKTPQILIQSIDKDLSNLKISNSIKLKYKFEPFRLKLFCISEKLNKTKKLIFNQSPYDYSPINFIKDLKILKDSLFELNKRNIYSKKLENLIWQISTFGYSMMSLDIRQHSAVHEKVISEILNKSSKNINYMILSEEERCITLTDLIKSGEKFLDYDLNYSMDTIELLKTLSTIYDENKLDENTIKSYIISMTHSASDILEVFYLCYEIGLYKFENGRMKLNLDIVPLLETINDLENSDKILKVIISNKLIRDHIKSRGNFQEIMLGYSDSNKDGGIGMANWSLQSAQKKISTIFDEQEIDFRLFHGRGGTISRGGGRANKAILAQPINNGRIRMTEQGEVISYRYLMSSIAKRHLEQITNAALLGMINSSVNKDNNNFHFFNSISKKSMDVYRKEVFSKSCWDFFILCSPIKYISNLPIASRPIFRNKNIIESEVSFEDLRAIPWVFSWVQNRTNITGWFGMGSALDNELKKKNGQDKLRKIYKESIFFKLLLNNISFEMSRCRLELSSYYTSLNENNLFFRIIDIEFKKMEKAYFEISGYQSYISTKPVIEKSILFRNPFTDILNLIQIELLRRYDKESTHNEEIQESIFLSINSIASAMQSTG